MKQRYRLDVVIDGHVGQGYDLLSPEEAAALGAVPAPEFKPGERLRGVARLLADGSLERRILHEQGLTAEIPR